jgi:hypothetical protein
MGSRTASHRIASQIESHRLWIRVAAAAPEGHYFRTLFANMAKQAGNQLDMFARGSFLDGLIGDEPLRGGGIGDQPRAHFKTAREAIETDNMAQSVAGELLMGLGLSERQALEWVSERNLGLYDMLIQGANSKWKGEFHRGIDADGIASSLASGISPLTGKLLSFQGEKPAAYFWSLGRQAAKMRKPRTVANAKGFAFKKGAQMATDIWRGDVKEQGMVQLDAPVPSAAVDSSQSLLDILQGEFADDPAKFTMGLGRSILEFENSFKILDPYVREGLQNPRSEAASFRVHEGRAVPPTEVEIWEALMANPDHITVKTHSSQGDGPARHEVKIEAKDLAKKILRRRGLPSDTPVKSWEKRVHDAARKIDKAMRAAFGREEVAREFSRSSDIKEVMSQEMRRRNKNHKIRMKTKPERRSPGPMRDSFPLNMPDLVADPVRIPSGLPPMLRKEVSDALREKGVLGDIMEDEMREEQEKRWKEWEEATGRSRNAAFALRVARKFESRAAIRRLLGLVPR